VKEISHKDFMESLGSAPIRVLDVRESWELPKIEGEFVTKIPIHQILDSLDQISKEDELIVVCQHGVRSKAVVEHLQTNFGYKNLINLRGGLTPYEQE
jgi:adenylyltransferase/sulfurtransferase